MPESPGYSGDPLNLNWLMPAEERINNSLYRIPAGGYHKGIRFFYLEKNG